MLYSLARPFLHALDPETAHGLTIKALKSGLMGRMKDGDDPILTTTLAGLRLPNPIGLAAGFDKNAEVMDAMLGLGFGFVEAGTVTPRPQSGNPKPRIFRLSEDRAVINRLGFNNQGLAAFAVKLRNRNDKAGIVGANVGANKDAEDRIADYRIGVERLAPLADYITVNISSPNTPGLRALQSKGALEELLGAVMAAKGAADTPVFLKIAPDLTAQDKEDIAGLALSSGIDGLIISNTTIARPKDLKSRHKGESGGLSGVPLFAHSTALLGEFYRLTQGKVPLIGVGGIRSGADAYAKIRAGASAVQLYTALIYEGPDLISHIKAELADLLRRDGFSNISEAVGANHPGL